MRDAHRLFWVIAVGSMMVTGLYFGLALGLAALLHKPTVPRIIQGAGLAVTVLAPICLAGFWVFRKLRSRYARREALTAAITFGVLAPVLLAMGLLLGPIVGGYAGTFLGTQSRLVAFSGAVAGIVVMVAFPTFLTSVLAIWVTRHAGEPRAAR